jgi:transposase-like protein
VEGVSTRRADDPVHFKGSDEMAKSFDAGWMAFLRGLVARGRSGVARVICNDHEDLK